MKSASYYNLDSVKNFIILLLLVGHPKEPFFGLPLSLILLVIFSKKILSILNNKVYFPQILTVFLFLIYCCIRWLLQKDSTLQDLNFIVILAYKAITGILIAKAFFDLLEKNFRLIYLYLTIQLTLIILSAYYAKLYAFLLMFQSGAAQTVFVHTFGIRSMGFGVIHNEGVTFLVAFYSFLIYKNQSKILGLLFSPFIYVTALTSRMGIILIAIGQAFISPSKLIFSFFTIFILIFFLLDTSSGPLSEAFELYNNYINFGELSSKSTDAISAMQYIPDNFLSWVFGDGRFFADAGFYMETDIGFSRIVFFGGIFGLIFYMLISLWPLFFIDFRNRDRLFYIFVLNLTIYFLLINIKGINLQNWAFITFLLMSKRDICKRKQMESLNQHG